MTDGAKHFLLVEDNDDHAELILECFQMSSVPATTAHVTDSAAALAYLRGESQTPDVILLDLNLPGHDGIELLHVIKSDETFRPIPVVVLTTSDAAIDRRRAYGRYANSYLVKPDGFDELRDLIEQVNRYWSLVNRPADDGENTQRHQH